MWTKRLLIIDYRKEIPSRQSDDYESIHSYVGTRIRAQLIKYRWRIRQKWQQLVLSF